MLHLLRLDGLLLGLGEEGLLLLLLLLLLLHLLRLLLDRLDGLLLRLLEECVELGVKCLLGLRGGE